MNLSLHTKNEKKYKNQTPYKTNTINKEDRKKGKKTKEHQTHHHINHIHHKYKCNIQ